MRKAMLAIVLLCAFLSACSVSDTSDLYARPQESEELLFVHEAVAKLLSPEAKLLTPRSGGNRQSIQWADILPEKESILVFFYEPGEKPLKIAIFEKSDNDMILIGTINQPGDSLTGVDYADLNGDGVKEIIAGFQSEASGKRIGVYSISERELTELSNMPYSAANLTDMDDDGYLDLFTVLIDNENQSGSATLISYRDGIKTYAAPLSDGISDSITLRTGKLSDGKEAAFSLCRFQTQTTSSLTDILVFRDNELVNITRDPETGYSGETVRISGLYSTDINGDGVLDLPKLFELPPFDPESDESGRYIIKWRQYDSNGITAETANTFHNIANGWYLSLPEAWLENLCIARPDGASGENIYVFATIQPNGDREILARIHTFTGDDRQQRAERGGLTTLYKSADMVVAVSLAQDKAPTLQEMTDAFHIIQTEWVIKF